MIINLIKFIERKKKYILLFFALLYTIIFIYNIIKLGVKAVVYALFAAILSAMVYVTVKKGIKFREKWYTKKLSLFVYFISMLLNVAIFIGAIVLKYAFGAEYIGEVLVYVYITTLIAFVYNVPIVK